MSTLNELDRQFPGEGNKEANISMAALYSNFAINENIIHVRLCPYSPSQIIFGRNPPWVTETSLDTPAFGRGSEWMRQHDA